MDTGQGMAMRDLAHLQAPDCDAQPSSEDEQVQEPIEEDKKENTDHNISPPTQVLDATDAAPDQHLAENHVDPPAPPLGKENTPPTQPTSAAVASHPFSFVTQRLEGTRALLWYKDTYAPIRDRLLITLSHPKYTRPLLGEYLTSNFLDINLLEVVFMLLFLGVVLGAGAASEWGNGTALASLFVVLTANRNSILLPLFGLTFERIIKYHRWFSTLLLVPLVLHATGYNAFTPCSDSPTFVSPGDDENRCFWGDSIMQAGFVAFVSYGLLFLLSLPPIRRHAFETFRLGHLLVVSYLIAAFFHQAAVIGWMAAPLLLYFVDISIRIYQRWNFAAKVKDLEQLPGAVRLVVDKNDVAGLRYWGGQYGFIHLPGASKFQQHPFSFASSPSDPTVSFLIRQAGGFTNRVSSLVKPGDSISLEGGYGAHSFPLASVEYLVLIAGGSGISPMVSTLKELVHTVKECGPGKLLEVHLLWTVRDTGNLEWFESELRGVEAAAKGRLEVAVRFNVTRPDKAKPLDASSDTPFGAGTFSGRLDVIGYLTQLRNKALALTHVAPPTCGVCVCGPSKMAYDVTVACARATTNEMVFVCSKESFEL